MENFLTTKIFLLLPTRVFLMILAFYRKVLFPKRLIIKQNFSCIIRNVKKFFKWNVRANLNRLLFILGIWTQNHRSI